MEDRHRVGRCGEARDFRCGGGRGFDNRGDLAVSPAAFLAASLSCPCPGPCWLQTLRTTFSVRLLKEAYYLLAFDLRSEQLGELVSGERLDKTRVQGRRADLSPTTLNASSKPFAMNVRSIPLSLQRDHGKLQIDRQRYSE